MVPTLLVEPSLYFDYPLEQGLRPRYDIHAFASRVYFDYPLEQGLRQAISLPVLALLQYFDYPLEQGLRQISFSSADRSLIIH